MRKPYRWMWWLILPACSTVVTGLRLATMQEQPAWKPGSLPVGPTAQPAVLHHPEAFAGRQPVRPAWIKHIGHLRLVKWGDRADESCHMRETVVLWDERGRPVARITGYGVDLVMAQDLTGDGSPDVVLRTWSGGVHGGFVYYVYSAEWRSRCLLAYYKKNGGEESERWADLAVRDLNGDGRKELVSWYDGFAHGGEVFNWASSYGGSATVPIALGLRKGRYVDVTSQYRPWLRRKLAEAREHFLDGLDEAKTEGLTGDRAQGMIEYYAVALLLYRRTTARRMALHILPEKDRAFFLEHCGLIEQVLADRRKRYAYPPAYSHVQAFASEACPPDDPDAAQTDSEAVPTTRRNLRP